MAMRMQDLTAGMKVAYAGFGPGQITEVGADARGQFVRIDIPHQRLNVRLPLPDGAERLRPLLSPEQARAALSLTGITPTQLPREWVHRRDISYARLADHDAHDWLALLIDYAEFARTEHTLAVSDHDLIGKAIAALASECAFALGQEYLPTAEALGTAWRAYAETSGPTRRRRRRRPASEESTDAQPAGAPA